jgi:hypothetical protein
MLDEMKTVANFDCVPKRLLNLVTGYVGFLTLTMRTHSFRAAAEFLGLDESRFSAFMNCAEAPTIALEVLCRSARRRLARARKSGRPAIIVDATILCRRGKGVENVGFCHSGSGIVKGHKFINFVFQSSDGKVIPLQSIAVYTAKYCADNGMAYETENDIVEKWILSLPQLGYLAPDQIKSAVFLLDSGYDAKPVQRAIAAIGSNFVMAIKSSRSVDGLQVSKLFRRAKRRLKNISIRLAVGSGSNRKRRKFSVRTARGARLKGFGLANVVCSKAESRRDKPSKFIAASDLQMGARDIVEWYARRWAIESWHRDMKQNFGFGDCRCSKFSAIEAHVSFCLAAYLLQKESGKSQRRLEDHLQHKQLRTINIELTKFGSGGKAKTLIYAALQRFAA